MTRRSKMLITGGIVLAVAIGIVLTSGPPPASPVPAGSFAFAVVGDAPYYPWEELQFRIVRRDLDAHDLAAIVHVGDIFWQPCTDEHYRKYLRIFSALRHPVIYTPGDNEWTDCWQRRPGGFDPLERLQTVRRVFFSEPGRSLGRRSIALVSQATDPSFSEFVENARWIHEGVVFATLHIVGSMNGMEPFPERTEASDEESRRRTLAATDWLREAFTEARALDAPALVLAFHAEPGWADPVDDPYRQAFEPLLTVLEEEAERFPRPILMIHGDWHGYTVDRPLIRRTSGARLDHVTRLQIPGSPEVGWVRVVFTPDADAPFSFESRIVPAWKYW